jgi:hypothetical protein
MIINIGKLGEKPPSENNTLYSNIGKARVNIGSI